MADRDQDKGSEENRSGVIAADARALGPSDGAMAEAASIELGAETQPVGGETFGTGAGHGAPGSGTPPDRAGVGGGGGSIGPHSEAGPGGAASPGGNGAR